MKYLKQETRALKSTHPGQAHALLEEAGRRRLVMRQQVVSGQTADCGGWMPQQQQGAAQSQLGLWGEEKS